VGFQRQRDGTIIYNDPVGFVSTCNWIFWGKIMYTFSVAISITYFHENSEWPSSCCTNINTYIYSSVILSPVQQHLWSCYNEYLFLFGSSHHQLCHYYETEWRAKEQLSFSKGGVTEVAYGVVYVLRLVPICMFFPEQQ
jgi:hypothetical protein